MILRGTSRLVIVVVGLCLVLFVARGAIAADIPIADTAVIIDNSPAGQSEVPPVGILDCVDDNSICFERPQQPDCVDGGGICFHEARPGPYGLYAGNRWNGVSRPHYGQLQYIRIDLNVGAYVDNLLAGAPNYPKTFCWRAENHANMGDPEGYIGFIAWSNFDPYLTEPADMTVVQRNKQPDTFNVHYNTVPQLAYQNRDVNGRIPIFVLNGSYFTPESAPEGSQARHGQFYRTDVNRTMLAISADGRRAEILWGDGSPIRYGEPRELQYVVCEQDENGNLYEPLRFAPGVDVSWIHTAIGGGPIFVLPDPNDLDANGNPRIKVSLAYSTEPTATTVPYNPLGESFGQPNSLYENNLDWEHRLDVYATRVPHTFLCTTSDNALIMGVSKGINGTELGRTLIQLGCTHAIALDDNSSSSFMWRGEYSRSLKVPGRYRYMGNAIGVYSRGGWTAPATQPMPRKSWAAEQLRPHNIREGMPSWVLLEQHFDQFGLSDQ